ncbi:MAG: hypothetical protein DRJ28_03150 [Actinobacteria bacterium]|nr:MAG: hypothetical protein DRJ28_03150 [Actinomycetota bacterium]
MNDQDRDLIAALAEGLLSGTEAEDALARIEADPEMSVEYSGQLSALDFLGSVVTPLMTTAEREALHVNLTEQLGLVPIPTPTPSPFRRRLPWWQPVFGLATAAAVVAAIVILPGTLTGGSSDNASFDLASAEPESTDVDQTQTTAAAAADGVQEAAPLDARALDDDAEIAVHETDTVSLEDLLKQTGGADSPDAVEEQLSAFGFESTVDLNADAIDSCIHELSDDLPDGIIERRVIGANAQDDKTIVHLGFDFGSGIEDGLSFVLEDCTLVGHGPQG